MASALYQFRTTPIQHAKKCMEMQPESDPFIGSFQPSIIWATDDFSQATRLPPDPGMVSVSGHC